MTALELKSYILENNKVEYILDSIGCHSIVYHPQKEYYSATQPDGDNKQGVIIKNCEYLKNYQEKNNNIKK